MTRAKLSISLLLLGTWLSRVTPVQAQPEWPDDVMAEEEAMIADEDTPEPATEATPRALLASLQAGLGMGSRNLSWPGQFGLSEAQTGPHLAYDLTAHLGLDRGPRMFGLRIEYQSSLNLTMSEQRVGAAPQELNVRSHHVLGGLFLNRRVSQNFALGSTLGYEARNIRAIARDTQLPGYTLSGPLVTLLLELRFLSERMWLRAEPQVQAIVQIGDAMRSLGVEPVGIAGGGELALGLRVVRRTRLELAFSLSRARVSGGDSPLQDSMQFLTLRIGGEL